MVVWLGYYLLWVHLLILRWASYLWKGTVFQSRFLRDVVLSLYWRPLSLDLSFSINLCSFWLCFFSIFLDQGNHLLKHDRSILGKTCGILPFGIGGYPISDSSEKSLTGVKVKTKGLEWDLGKFQKSFYNFSHTFFFRTSLTIIECIPSDPFWSLCLSFNPPRQFRWFYPFFDRRFPFDFESSSWWRNCSIGKRLSDLLDCRIEDSFWTLKLEDSRISALSWGPKFISFPSILACKLLYKAKLAIIHIANPIQNLEWLKSQVEEQ